MKKLFGLLAFLGAVSSVSAQYNGKYVGWSTGYIFTGNYSTIAWDCFTHLCNFQVTVSGSGGVNPGSLAVSHKTFIDGAHAHNAKAIICIGGQGQSRNFSAATSSPSTQTTLVKNICKLIRDNGYDGVDMDWESGEENDGAAMTTKFKSLHKELYDSLQNMPGKPFMTAAVATDWYPNCSAAIAPYVIQLNNMSYYDRVDRMDALFKPVLDRGVSKAIQGVGFGFDTDNEITDPNDIEAKCKYAIDKGYGGIMVWDIAHAPASTMARVQKYVNKNAVSIAPAARPRGQTSLLIVSGAQGLQGAYDMKGALVSPLAPGNYVSLLSGAAKVQLIR